MRVLVILPNYMPKVYNKRDKSIPKDAVYVGRPTKWGNPYSHLVSELTVIHVETRELAVEKYKQLVSIPKWQERIRKELKGKDLVCWCAPLACHADVLLEIANSEL